MNKKANDRVLAMRRFLGRAQLTWLVPQIREDGQPAVWLTFENWLLIRDGIVRAYLTHREGCGEYRARLEFRRALGAEEWRRHPRLKSYETLDSWPGYASNAENAINLFRVGFEAWKHVGDPPTFTPEKMQARGDKAEDSGYCAENKRLRLLDGARMVTALELVNRLAEHKGHRLKNFQPEIEAFEVWPDDVSETWLINRGEFEKLDALVEERKAVAA